MATEGVILYVMLVKVFPTSGQSPRKRLFFICSWGEPSLCLNVLFSMREGLVELTHIFNLKQKLNGIEMMKK